MTRASVGVGQRICVGNVVLILRSDAERNAKPPKSAKSGRPDQQAQGNFQHTRAEKDWVSGGRREGDPPTL